MFEHLDLAKKNAEVSPESFEWFKDRSIVDRVRSVYKTDSDELAILRKEVALLSHIVAALTESECVNSDEFKAYHAYVEECKTSVKSDLAASCTEEQEEVLS